MKTAKFTPAEPVEAPAPAEKTDKPTPVESVEAPAPAKKTPKSKE